MLKLYRYQLNCVERLKKLKRGELWMSDPKTFNDPMDMQLVVRDLTSRWSGALKHKENIRNALSNLIGDGTTYGNHWLYDDETIETFKSWCKGTLLSGDSEENQLILSLKNALNKFGVCCLTPTLDSVLMWAHYANNSKGFCIEYVVDWTKIPKDFLYLPVQYLSELQELCITEAMFTPHQFLNRALASKSSDWAYEREIRIIYCEGKAMTAAAPETFIKIGRLIAGLNMPKESNNDELSQIDIVNTAESLKVPAYRMVKKHGYDLYCEPIRI
jgi:hypothetical protein